MPMIRGVVFDLDGTLIDSRLDFPRIRAEMRLPPGQVGILESVLALADESHRAHCEQVLWSHEQQGAQSATLMDGARELLRVLAQRQIPTAVLTRNSRRSTDLALNRLDLGFSQVLTREDAPPKPDPAGLLQICENWGFTRHEVLFVGDFQFDLQTGQQAGVRTVLYAPGVLPTYADEADFVIPHLSDLVDIVERLSGMKGEG